MDVGVDDVDAVFVGEGGVGPFPCRDASAAGTEGNRRAFHPGGAETVEEICFSCYLAVLEVRVSEFADVDLGRVSSSFLTSIVRSPQCLGSCRNQCGRTRRLRS